MKQLTNQQKKFFEDKNFAFVATLDKDGSPQVTPTWVDTDGTHILINASNTRRKIKNVLRDPRVAVALVDQEDPYSWIVVQGKVISHENGREAEEHQDKLSKKYTGEKFTNTIPDSKRVLLKILPLKITQG